MVCLVLYNWLWISFLFDSDGCWLRAGKTKRSLALFLLIQASDAVTHFFSPELIMTDGEDGGGGWTTEAFELNHRTLVWELVCSSQTGLWTLLPPV